MVDDIVLWVIFAVFAVGIIASLWFHLVNVERSLEEKELERRFMRSIERLQRRENGRE